MRATVKVLLGDATDMELTKPIRGQLVVPHSSSDSAGTPATPTPADHPAVPRQSAVARRPASAPFPLAGRPIHPCLRSERLWRWYPPTIQPTWSPGFSNLGHHPNQ